MIVLRLFLLIAFLASSSCVYFNTYYNAKKYFRQAEKARKKQKAEQAALGDSRVNTLRSPQGDRRLYDQAAQKAWDVVEKYPESDLVDDAAFLMGRAFYWQGNYLQAIRTFKDLEEKFPDSEYYDRARYWRALCYEAQEDDQAKELFRSLSSTGTGEVSYQSGYRLGEIEFAAENYVAAAQEYQSTLDAFPKADIRAELYLRLGESLFALEDSMRYDESLAAFAQVRRESPTTEVEYKARLNRGQVFYAEGDVESALKTYTALLKESRFRPFEGQTRLAIGQYYQDRHLLDEALREYEQVRDDFPQSEPSAMALYRTGLLYLQEYGDTERADEYFKEIREEKGNSSAAVLGQRILKDMAELERLRQRIHRADSLAAVNAGTVDTSAVAGAGLDSLAVLETGLVDSLAAAKREPVDSLAVAGAGLDSLAVLETGLVDSLAVVSQMDSSQRGEEAASWFFEKLQEGGGKALSSADEEVMDDLFAMAEIFRHKIEQPDSAAHYYTEITRRFPDSDQVLRALYAIAWVHLELKEDMAGSRPYLERVIEEYPASEHANAARRYLDQEIQVTAEELAAAEFVDIEQLWVRDADALHTYVPLLDSLSRKYPTTQVAARAAFLAARQYENIRGDSLEAERRYERLLEDFPSSRFAKLVKERRESQSTGVLAKLERGIRSLIGGSKPGERIEIIAVEPDSADSVFLARKHFRFALRAYLRGEQETALEQCELSLEQMERNPDALYYKGNILSEQGYIQDAIDQYNQVLHYDGNHLGVNYRLFATYVSEGVADSANHYLHQIINKDARNFQIQYLVEEHPELRPSEREDQDMYTLESLELQPPQDNLVLRQGELLLQELPLVRKMVLPQYPKEAEGDSAEVILDILVGRDGRAETIEVFKGEELFREAAVEAARNYLFYPAEGRPTGRDENKVRIWVELVVPVRPNGSVVSNQEYTTIDGDADTEALPDSSFQDTVLALPELPDNLDNFEVQQE
jgi:TolA-binding protein